MASIPGWIYLIIGGGIAITARYVDLEIFFWFGLLFVVVGVFKIVVRFITKEKNHPAFSSDTDMTPAKPKISQENYPKYCPRCRLMYARDSNFCSRCGSQLFIKP